MTEADLTFLAHQNERLITDVARLRDDMRVVTAIVMRLDNTRENARAARTDDRLRRLEEAGQ